MVATAGAGWRLAPCLVACIDECDEVFPNRDHTSDGSIGDTAHSARTSDHNPSGGYVCAVDIDEDLSATVHSLGPFAEHLRRGRDPRVKYVIYEGRIFKSYVDSAGRPAWEWQTYTGVNDHSHHLHLSVVNTAACRNDLQTWGFAEAYAPKPPAPPVEEDTVFIAKGDGYVTRLVDPPFVVKLSPTEEWNCVARGVKVLPLDQPTVAELVKQSGQALD